MEEGARGPAPTMETAPAAAGMAEETRAAAESKKMKVVVAVDESEGSLYALSWTLDHLFTSAGETPDRRATLGSLILLHVQPPLQHYFLGPGPVVYASSSAIDTMKKAQEQNSANVLSRALQICNERLVKAEAVVMDGDPKDMICEATEHMHADLLVVGSRGLGKIKRTFLGSVSDYATHHASCPILIVKPPKVNH